MIFSTYNAALTKLQKKHSVLDVIDLSSTTIKSTLLFKLEPYRNKEFADNERIIFVVDKSAQTTFEQQPPDILPDLQSHIRDLNIPHFFVIILTNITNLHNHLQILHQSRYYQETIPITVIYVND